VINRAVAASSTPTSVVPWLAVVFSKSTTATTGGEQ
jgi:hypothetical protein